MFLVFVSIASQASDVAQERAEARMSEALDRVDATPAQRQAAEERLDDFLTEIRTLRERTLDVRERVHDALFGATVDRRALEAARRDLVAAVDQGTSVFFDFAADLSELFTPAQRDELHDLRHQRLRERLADWWSSDEQ